MKTRLIQFASATAMIGAMLAFAGPASAETVMQQCGTKYQAAKLVDPSVTWAKYLPACRAELQATPAAATDAPPVKPNVAPAAPVVLAPPVATPPKPTVAARPPVVVAPPVAAAPGAAVFPSAISPAHASEKPGKARENTCLDQYKINKANNTNGGLKWIEKGGGYYSQCNKLLKA